MGIRLFGSCTRRCRPAINLSRCSAWQGIRRLGITLLTFALCAQQTNAFSQDCEWLSKYVKDSLPSFVEIRQSGSTPSNQARGAFPLGPARVSLSIAFSSDTLPERHNTYAKFIESIIDNLKLPIEMLDGQQNPYVLIYFFRRGYTAADTPKLLSQFRAIPNRQLFRETFPHYDILIFSLCFTNVHRTADGRSRVTVFVPLDDAGAPVDVSRRCVTEGLLKSLGVSLNRDGWTDNCDSCLETDRRMARILLENNKSARVRITADEMVRRLTGAACETK
jgi:hypothetical protein